MRMMILITLFASLGCQYYDRDGSDVHAESDWHHDADHDIDEAAGDGGSIGQPCRAHGDCDGGERCLVDVCVPAPSCSTDDDCMGSDACDARMTCIDPTGCRDESDCEPDEVCADAQCTPLEDACQFDRECGPQRGCVDNACRNLCLDETECAADYACVAGHCNPLADVCTSSADCAEGAHCSGGRCFMGCLTDAECATGELCGVDGLCRADVGPQPFCVTDAECAAGHLCLNGVCRTPCPTGTLEECASWDSQFVRCGESTAGPLLCYTRNESNPECLSSSDCGPDETCIDAICH